MFAPTNNPPILEGRDFMKSSLDGTPHKYSLGLVSLVYFLGVGASYVSGATVEQQQIDALSVETLSNSFSKFRIDVRRDAVIKILNIARGSTDISTKLLSLDRLEVPYNQLAGKVRGLALYAIGDIAQKSKSAEVEQKAVKILKAGLDSYSGQVRASSLEEIRKIGVSSNNIGTKKAAIAAIGFIWSPKIDLSLEKLIFGIGDTGDQARQKVIEEIRVSARE